jgi:hypothetical protein
MTQQRPDSRQQFSERKRLADIIIGAEVQAHHSIPLLRASRKHEDGRVESLAAHPPAQVVSAQLGQHQVEDQEVRLMVADGPLAGFAINRCQDLVRLELQIVPQAA